MSDDFSYMMQRLEGVTVLPQPKVPREVMVEILREHTTILKGLRGDIVTMSQRMEIIAAEAAGNQKGFKDFQVTVESILTGFRVEVEKNAADVALVAEANAGFQAQMDEMTASISDFPQIKAETIRQKEQVDNVVSKMEMLTAEMAFFLKTSSEQFTALEDKSTVFALDLKALRTHVDGLADALVLSSNQITVAASAGFGNKVMNLFEVLKLCNTSVMALQGTTSEHTNQIADNVKATAKKADESVLVEIANHDTKIHDIEEKLRKDEEEGVNALRKSCRQLADMVEHLQFDLEEKVDVRSVDAIVHKKYEEIVHYLKDALSATQDDEKHFKEKVEEFQKQVQKLSVTKVDRSEVAPMQEFIVTAESTLKKLTKEKEHPKEVFTKDELMPILEAKLNKADYEEGYDSLMKVLKKTRKLAALSGNYGEPGDDSNQSLANLKKPLLSSTAMGLLSKSNDKPRGSGVSAGRAMTASAAQQMLSNNSNFAAYALREKQVRMQLQTAATVVSLPPGDPFMGGELNDESSLDDPRSHISGRPKTTGERARVVLKSGSRPGTSTASIPGGSTAERSRYSSPPRMGGEADVAHVGSATAGAGFNLRSTSPLPKEPLTKLTSHATDFTDPDLDITETMVEGIDGRLYYGDGQDDSGGAPVSVVVVPTN